MTQVWSLEVSTLLVIIMITQVGSGLKKSTIAKVNKIHAKIVWPWKNLVSI